MNNLVELPNQNAMQTFSDERIALVKRTLADGTTDNEFLLFIEQCKRTGLSPENKQIYCIVRGQGPKRKAMTQVAIDGFRLIATRTGRYHGQLGPFWCGDDGEWNDVWLGKGYPVAAKVAVLHKDFNEPLWAVAKWSSYMQGYNGQPANLWAKMPDLMLGKCAEALALRKAFPNDLSGLYTSDEMAQDNNQVQYTPPNYNNDSPNQGVITDEKGKTQFIAGKKPPSVSQMLMKHGVKPEEMFAYCGKVRGQDKLDDEDKEKLVALLLDLDDKNLTISSFRHIIGQAETWEKPKDELDAIFEDGKDNEVVEASEVSTPVQDPTA